MNRATVLVLLGGLGVTTVFIVAPGASAGGPFVPKSDAEVLEVVPRGVPRRSTAPLSADQAAEHARRLLEEAHRTGEDPRLLGRAQATLAPWWNEPAPPDEIRLLRAVLKQRLGDFEGALADLAEPLDARGWLTRAQVLMTLARYDEAGIACEKAGDALCAARLAGLQGRANEAMASLSPAGERVGERADAVRGELEHWLGDDARAVASLERAVAADPTDTASRLLLAQLHLDLGQSARAVKLFERGASPLTPTLSPAGERETLVLGDPELLMLVLALSASKAPEYAARRAELDERMAANRQRGDPLLRRDESRYALALEGDVARALDLAVQNWAVQQEPADARVLLEAAVAAKDPRAAAPVLRWLAQTKFTQPRLLALAKELGAP